MASVTFSSVGKVYPDGTRAVNELDLEVGDGEFTVFVGPSGCGKTTALRMVAGLEDISEGEIRIGDQVVNATEPRKRDIAMVFQNYALYPHMTIFENIAFPLRSHRMKGEEVSKRVNQTARMLGLEEYLQRKPKTLSGGQRQRVAMGRAIVRQPQAFLMDEPLSNLDAKLRVQMRAEIAGLQRELGVTTIYVTHDQVEALTMGTRIAIMRKGVLQQYGTPQEVYSRPANLFVGTFIGSPAMNLVKARLRSDGDGLACVFGERGQSLTLGSVKSLAPYTNREIAVGIRPEDLYDGAQLNGDTPRLGADVALVESLGSEQLVHVELDAEPVVTEDVLEVARDVDASSVQTLRTAAGEKKVRVVARFNADASVAAGQTVSMAVRPDRLHFFDLETGRAVA